MAITLLMKDFFHQLQFLISKIFPLLVKCVPLCSIFITALLPCFLMPLGLDFINDEDTLSAFIYRLKVLFLDLVKNSKCLRP